ncbi:MAG: ParB/RepB/Spo0J family partition protein [Gemmatimonadaceae bacterium]|nr:ParB/RepB/Spo0J family partition protein [Gemmatimonadaceae bacterium]
MKRARLSVSPAAPTDSSAIMEAHRLADAESLCYLPTDALQSSPWQPRRALVADDDFAALAASIREYGVLEPLLVRATHDGYELLAGERRLRAARSVGLLEVPARVVRVENDLTARAIALVENLARQDLTPFDEACAIRVLADAYSTACTPLSIRDLAAKTGRSKSGIERALAIARGCTPEVWRAAFDDGRPPDWAALPVRVLEVVARSTSAAERTATLRAWADTLRVTESAVEVASAPMPSDLRRGPRPARPRLETTGDVSRGRWSLTLRSSRWLRPFALDFERSAITR